MKRQRAESEREDVVSTETWNGGDGTILFNHLQQGPIDDTERPETPLEAIGTTDPWGIAYGWLGDGWPS